MSPPAASIQIIALVAVFLLSIISFSHAQYTDNVDDITFDPTPPVYDCNHIWTYDEMLLPKNEIRVNHTENSGGAGIVQTKWHGEKFADVYQSHSSPCTQATPASSSQLSSPITIESMLCTTSSNISKKPKYRTLVIWIDDVRHKFDDMLSVEPSGLNLWHFHANYFTTWFSPNFVPYATHLLKRDMNIQVEQHAIPPQRGTPFAVLLILPPQAWERLESNGSTPFLAVGDTLVRQHFQRGGHETSLAGLQAISDGFQMRMVTACHTSSLGDIRRILEENEFETRPYAWVVPPGREGFMWNLAQHKLIASRVENCTGSILADYSHDMLSSSSSSSSQIIKANKEKNQLARHVCIISRQMRAKPGQTERFKLRNLLPWVFSRMVIGMGSVIVISPNLDLRNSSEPEVPFRLDRASITGQMKFIHEECGVVVGVHGAGLTSILGLRKGGAVVEIQMEDKQYEFFKNLGALMDDVDYYRVFANGTHFDRLFEGDFYFTPEKERQLHQVVRKALKKSLRKQLWYGGKGLNSKLRYRDAMWLEKETMRRRKLRQEQLEQQR